MGEQNHICPNCRTELDDHARFCAKCGSRIDFQTSRSALGVEEVEESSLVAGKNVSGLTNPFVLSASDFRNKIINPELGQQPELELQPESELKSEPEREIAAELLWKNTKGCTEAEESETSLSDNIVSGDTKPDVQAGCINTADLSEGLENRLFEYIVPELHLGQTSKEDVWPKKEIQQEEVQPETEAQPEAIIKPNRIITAPVGGGFKRR